MDTVPFNKKIIPDFFKDIIQKVTYKPSLVTDGYFHNVS